jgi:hypothetical protein
MQRNWNLSDLFAAEDGFDDHPRGELHTRATLVKPSVHGFGKTPQTAVNVVDRRAEPFPCKKGKNWIPNPTM